jgi:hypothetical protein
VLTFEPGYQLLKNAVLKIKSSQMNARLAVEMKTSKALPTEKLSSEVPKTSRTAMLQVKPKIREVIQTIVRRAFIGKSGSFWRKVTKKFYRTGHGASSWWPRKEAASQPGAGLINHGFAARVPKNLRAKKGPGDHGFEVLR